MHPSRGLARCRSELLDVLAGAVARAVVGAGVALAALAGVALEALALASGAIADALAGALHVLVEVAVLVRSVHECELGWAVHLGAVTAGLVCHAPVLVARAEVISTAGSVTGALVWAHSRS